MSRCIYVGDSGVDCVCCSEDFIKSRFCSIYFIVILARLKKMFIVEVIIEVR